VRTVSTFFWSRKNCSRADCRLLIEASRLRKEDSSSGAGPSPRRSGSRGFARERHGRRLPGQRGVLRRDLRSPIGHRPAIVDGRSGQVAAHLFEALEDEIPVQYLGDHGAFLDFPACRVLQKYRSISAARRGFLGKTS
jgi:hypothetical protein